MIYEYSEKKLPSGLVGYSLTVDVYEDDLIEHKGKVRFDIFPEAIMANPQVEEFNKSNAKAVKEAMFNVGSLLCKRWSYDEVYIATRNERMVNFFSEGRAKKVQEEEIVIGTGEYLYKYEVDQWPQQ